MKTKRVVAFDGDDTLWHNELIFSSIEEKFRRLLEKYVEPEEVSSKLYKIEMQNLDRYGYGAKGFVLSMIETAIQITNRSITGKEIEVIVGFLKEILDHPVRLIDSAKHTLQLLSKTYRLGLITKGELFHQELKISNSGLADYFDHVRIVSAKDEATYTEIMADWEVVAADFLMVGNSESSDILPVVKCGSHAIHIPYPVTWTHERVEPEMINSVLFHRVGSIGEVTKVIASEFPAG